MIIKKLIGTDANQVPMNRDLGSMAFQDAENPRTNQLTVTQQIYGTATGKFISLGNSNWTPILRTTATIVGIRFEVVSGHNSGIYYYTANSSTYTYNVANGTTENVIVGAGGIGEISIRRVKDSTGAATTYSGDGEWEYQIQRNTSYTTGVYINIMGGQSYPTTRWLI